MTAAHVPLRCACGQVQGQLANVSPKTGNRLVCMCDDCQTYARFLSDGAILDANGGTEVYQTPVSALSFASGQEHIQCVRLSPKGLWRWYASCCRTPIANTMGPKGPFAGNHVMMLDLDADGRTREQACGPIRGRVQAKFGYGDLPPDASKNAPLGLMLRALRMTLGWWLQGAAKGSPFFDDAGAPIVTPQVLTLEERNAFRHPKKP